MNFALFGYAPAAVPLVRAIAADPQHAVLTIVEAGGSTSPWAAVVPSARVTDRWEDVLADHRIDAALVADDSAAALDGARQLATAGKPLLLLPRAGQGAAFAYELSLIRDESGVTVFPVLPLREHPLFERVRALVANGSLGEQLHAQFHREVHRATAAGQALVLSPRDLDERFLGDVDLLRALSGDFAQLHAVRSGLSSEGITLANVTLAGGKRMEAAWSCVPTAGAGGWTLTLRGPRGTAILTGDDEGGRLVLQTQIEGQPAGREEQAFDAGPRILEQFQAAVDGEPTSPGWIDGLRAFELLATAHHSLERRRAIDLHFDPPSERSTFKTQMTAVGCSLLMLTLFGMVALLLIGAAARELGLPPIVMRIGVFLVFAPLGIFLLLQMLLVLAKPSSSSGRAA